MDETGPYRRTLLRAMGVTKRYGDLVALGGVDLDVPRHSIVSLIGPNGAGKTVMFNVLTGLTRPDGGTIWFNGESTARMSVKRAASLITYAISFCDSNNIHLAETIRGGFHEPANDRRVA